MCVVDDDRHGKAETFLIARWMLVASFLYNCFAGWSFLAKGGGVANVLFGVWAVLLWVFWLGALVFHFQNRRDVSRFESGWWACYVMVGLIGPWIFLDR